LIRAVLDDAADSVRTELSAEREVRATIQDIIGRAYFKVTEFDKALPHLQAALETRIELFGDKNADVASSHHHLAELLKERGLPGDYEQSEILYKKALALRQALFGEMSVEVASSLNDLGQLYFKRKNYDKAEGPLRKALDIREKLLGRQDKDTASSLANVGSLLRDRAHKADLKDARLLLEDALRSRRALLGDHPHVAVSMNKLALLLRDEGEYEQAKELLQEALKTRLKFVGADHHLVAVSLHNLAQVLQFMGDHETAKELFDQAVETWIQELGGSHADVASGLKSRAGLRRSMGEYEMAKADCAEAIRIWREHGSEPDRGSADVLVELGRIYLAEGDLKAARSYLDDALEFYRKSQPDGARAATAESALGECLAKSGQDAEAETLLRRGYRVLEDIRGPKHIDTREARDRLARFFEERNQPEEAAKYKGQSGQSGQGGAAG
jgi:tetratricopeptide (TPR) repeat protein